MNFETKYFSPPAAELAQILAPERTAVVVIDIQNDFGHPEGVIGRAGANLSMVDDAVDAAERLIAAARAAGAPVIFMGLQTSKELDSRPGALRRARLGQPYAEDRRVCRAGAWGADWYRVKPEPGDIQLTKPRYSSFQDTTLDLQLRALGVDTVILCGLTTECCVETGVRDAYHRDYNVFLAEDACASTDMAMHTASVRVMSIFCALILKTAAIEAAWSLGAAPAGQPAAQPMEADA